MTVRFEVIPKIYIGAWGEEPFYQSGGHSAVSRHPFGIIAKWQPRMRVASPGLPGL